MLRPAGEGGGGAEPPPGPAADAAAPRRPGRGQPAGVRGRGPAAAAQGARRRGGGAAPGGADGHPGRGVLLHAGGPLRHRHRPAAEDREFSVKRGLSFICHSSRTVLN